MPIYVFQCKKCKEKFEELLNMNFKKNPSCPKCKSKKTSKLMTASNFNFTNPIGTDKWNSHDYRYKYNLPNVMKEREQAKKLYHDEYNTIHDEKELDTGIHDME